MSQNNLVTTLYRLRLRSKERRVTQILRNQVAALSSLLEVVLSILVLIGLLISTIPIANEMFSLVSQNSTEAFQTFLGHPSTWSSASSSSRCWPNTAPAARWKCCSTPSPGR